MVEKKLTTLLTKPESCNPNAWPDALLCLACDIESMFIQGGAKPGKDYSALDLFNLAQPLVVEMFRKGKLA